MKRTLKTSIVLMIFGLFLLFSVSCTVKTVNPLIRIPFDELKTGGFYSGSLLHSPLHSSSLKHLGKGTLIAFQDITYGWEVNEASDSMKTVIKGKDYGYLFIRSIDEQAIHYDYLIFNAEGEIKDRGESCTESLSTGEARFSDNRGKGYSGIDYHMLTESTHTVVGDSNLLTFRNEFADIRLNEEMSSENVSPEDTFRRVVFRVQQTGSDLTSRFPGGVIAVSASKPKTLVVNSAFHTLEEIGNSSTNTAIAFRKTDELPDFSAGDYILDSRWGIVRRVETVEASGNTIVLETQQAELWDALGTVVLSVEGSLSELMQRYHSLDNPQNPQRKHFKIYEDDFETTIIDEQAASAKLKNHILLDSDMSIDLHHSIDTASSHGHFSFPMELKTILDLTAEAGIDEDGSKELAEVSIPLDIDGLSVKVTVPLELTYSLQAQLEKLQYKFGPDLKFNMTFDYTIKVYTKWECTKKMWGHCVWGKYVIKDEGNAHADFSHSETFIGPEIDSDDNAELDSVVGLSVSPGITIEYILTPKMSMPFTLETKLKDGHTDAYFEAKGEMEMELDLKLYDHTWHFGTLYDQKAHIYSD